MTKPFYDPKTKETYLKFTGELPNGIPFVCRAITGSFTLGRYGHPSVWRNELGEITKTAPFVMYGTLK